MNFRCLAPGRALLGAGLVLLGAVFAAAIDRSRFNSSSFLGRSAAKRELGDLDGAIKDCQEARNRAETEAERSLAERTLKKLQSQPSLAR